MAASEEFVSGPETNSSLDVWTRREWPPAAELERALRLESRWPWEPVASLAARQHGVIAAWQLRALGVSRPTWHRRASAGYLHRVHRGVYAVGHPALSRRGTVFAAILACGRGAMASGLDAAAAQRVWTGELEAVDITVARGTRLQRRGIVLHRSLALTPADVEVRDRMPLTSLPRTLLDIAIPLGPTVLRDVIGAAQRRGSLQVPAIVDLLARSRGARGSAVLADAIAELREHGGVTRRELERRFLRLCRRYGLPTPLVNAFIEVPGDRFQVDFHWPGARLVVETDGYASHSDLNAHNRDRHRDQQLKLMGWEVVRFTWQQVTEDPAGVAHIVRSLLAE